MGMSVIQYQHVKKRCDTKTFDDIQKYYKTFDVSIDAPDVQLGVGDVITFQEVDQDGNLTGREVSKKIVYKSMVREPVAPLFASKEEAEGYKASVLGFAAPEYRTLRSVYEIAYTMHAAVDVDKQGVDYKISEGPYYGPILASPDFLEARVLDGIHIDKWPAGRYSVTLMIKLSENSKGKTDVDIIDGLIMTIVPGSDESFGIKFEELDIVALLGGDVVSVDGKELHPMLPKKIDETVEDYKERYQKEKELNMEQGLKDVLGIEEDQGLLDENSSEKDGEPWEMK